MNLKVSHESPLSMMLESRNYNDYDYALAHIMTKYPNYLQFFIDSRKVYDREVILDSGIFETGHALNSAEYIEVAKKIKPTLIIAPDVLEDHNQTIANFQQFKDTYKNTLYKECNTAIIGVVQGKTYKELQNCYIYMSRHADMIALSFDYSFFVNNMNGENKWEKMMRGRQQFVTNLINENIWDWDKSVHCLGASLPQEFKYYINRNIYNIISCDTSSPIIHGLLGKKYNSTFGLREKESKKLVDLIEAEPSQEQEDIIYYNIDKFREICS